mmetsp:Transcript_133729/g.333726  ORF Transcript_133729/g.333726 Transcript_133729/m.333726 type:complete len:209 (-) Transcript_133729:1214-1840(-)
MEGTRDVTADRVQGRMAYGLALPNERSLQHVDDLNQAPGAVDVRMARCQMLNRIHDGFGLADLHHLLDVSQLDLGAPVCDATKGLGGHLVLSRQPLFAQNPDCSVIGEGHGVWHFPTMPPRDSMCLLCHVAGPVALHADHRVRDRKKVAAPSDHHHRAHALVLKEGFHPLNEGSDRLLVGRDKLNHRGISDHEVCGARVLVDQHRRGS